MSRDRTRTSWLVRSTAVEPIEERRNRRFDDESRDTYYERECERNYECSKHRRCPNDSASRDRPDTRPKDRFRVLPFRRRSSRNLDREFPPLNAGTRMTSNRTGGCVAGGRRQVSQQPFSRAGRSVDVEAVEGASEPFSIRLD